MKTVNEIKGACRLVEDDCGVEHWIWAGGSHNGRPKIFAPNFTADPSGKTMTCQSGCRAVEHIVTGAPIKKGLKLWAACMQLGCVRPECVTKGKPKQHFGAIKRSGIWRDVPARILANRKNYAKQIKATPEMIADVMSSNDSVAAKAARHGVERCLISRIHTGKAVRQTPMSGLFSGLIKKR